MRSLGREVDVVQSSFSTPRWGDACQKLRIVNVPFYIDLPRTSPLARKTRITVADLEGMRLRVLRHGNDAMDSLRIDLLADGGVDVIDVDSFDFALFNEAEEKGDAVLTCGAWSGVHPAFVGVPFLCGRERVPGLFALSARANPPSPEIRQRHGPTPQVAKRVPSQISYPLRTGLAVLALRPGCLGCLYAVLVDVHVLVGLGKELAHRRRFIKITGKRVAHRIADRHVGVSLGILDSRSHEPERDRDSTAARSASRSTAINSSPPSRPTKQVSDATRPSCWAKERMYSSPFSWPKLLLTVCRLLRSKTHTATGASAETGRSCPKISSHLFLLGSPVASSR